jgi:undecaprenyl-diphosphatase
MTFGESALAHDVQWSAVLRAAGERAPWLRRVAIPLARSGDAWIWFVAAGVLAALGNSAVRRDMVFVVLVIVVTGLVVKLGKVGARRARPNGDWGGSYRRQDPHAFPSGHAARAAVLTVLGFVLGPAWLGPVMVVWTTLVAVSRVVLGVHYVSDVVGGAVLGLVCGLVALTV